MDWGKRIEKIQKERNVKGKRVLRKKRVLKKRT